MAIRRAVVLGAALATLAGAAGGIPASAAARVVITDRAGDQAIGGGGYDLLEVELSTEDRGPGSGRWMVITWRLAEAPPPAGAAYGLEGFVRDCGWLVADLRVGTVYDRAFTTALGGDSFMSLLSVECEEDQGGPVYPEVEVTMEGRTLQMKAAIDWFPVRARSGEIRSIRAWSHPSDPVAGVYGTDLFGMPSDEARARETFDY